MKRYFLFIFLSLSVLSYAQEKRLALVIGNSAYEHGGALKNPVNDAAAMKHSLTQLGFDVLVDYDLGQSDLKKAIDYFGMKLNNYDVGLFFYAGHGIQSKGYNYLIPVDANITSEQQVEYDCVQADRVLAQMEASTAKVKLIILDACRNNPFERSWTRSTNGIGLAFMNAPTGTLIAYATAPGSTASDGSGANGLYTESILESLKIPGLTIMEMFQNVRSIVTQKSAYQQTPWESTSLIGNFYFNSGGIVLDKASSSNIITRPSDQILTESSNILNDTVGYFLDLRDNERYKWIKIGQQRWMSENLMFKSESSISTKNIEGSSFPVSQLYEWEDAQAVCPDGWHLPTEEDWIRLELLIGIDSAEAGNLSWRGTDEANKLKSNAGWKKGGNGVDEFGFNALPMGYFQEGVDAFIFTSILTTRIKETGSSAVFWSANEYHQKSGYYRMLNAKNSTIFRGEMKKTNRCSVRCVMNKP